MMITVEPTYLDRRALQLIKMLVVVGDTAIETLQQYWDATKISVPEINQSDSPGDDEALLWSVGSTVRRIKPLLGERESRRHRRKYATGEIAPDYIFYFRCPEEKLNLRAHNLQTFVQLAEGIDDATWMFHLRRGDYSRWFNDVIKDKELAQKAEKAEQNDSTSARDSRELIREVIEILLQRSRALVVASSFVKRPLLFLVKSSLPRKLRKCAGGISLPPDAFPQAGR
jgi:hypothetical protein